MSLSFFTPRDWNTEETSDGPRIVIPAPRIWPLPLFFGFWLCGWTTGELAAGRSLLQILQSGPSGAELLPAAFLAVWLCAWTLGGLFVWAIFFFSLNGREVVNLQGDRLRIRLETFLGLGWNRFFSLQGMLPPRLQNIPIPVPKTSVPGQTPGAPGLNYSHLVIESGTNRWRLGLGMEEQRAKELLYTLVTRFGLPREGFGHRDAR
ncbi:MAG TPA: hypothetical protein PKI19_01530 [Elusimicrobiales bacterium]|nr:hypothetical protein [Elusimicrobiales bacterium]